MKAKTTPMTVVACVLSVAALVVPCRSEESSGLTGEWVRVAQDDAGNLHMVYAYSWGACYYSKYSGGTWSSPVVLPNSSPCWFDFTNPDIDVGPDGIPQVVYGTTTGDPHPNDLNPVIYAKATDQNGSGWNLTYIGDSNFRRNHARIAVDENNVAHIAYMKTNKYPEYWWEIIYRRPDGTEKVIQHTGPDSYRSNNPDIAYKDGIVHVTWFEGGSGTMTTNTMHAAGAPYSDFPVFEQLTNMPYMWFVTTGCIAIAPDGQADIVYIVQDFSGSPGMYKGVYSTRTGVVDGGWAIIEEEEREDWAPNITFMNDGTRFVVWSHFSNGETMYVRNSEPKVTMTPWGSIDACAGATGAWYVRAHGAGGPVYYQQLEGGGPQLYPPTAVIDNVTPNPATRGVDNVVNFLGTGFDNDEGGASITAWEWTSNWAGVLGTSEDISVATIDLTPGSHIIRFSVRDDENVWSAYDQMTLEVEPDPIPPPAVDDLAVRQGFMQSLIIQWSPVVDNLAMEDYKLYRGTTAWFSPVDLLTEIDSGQPLTFTDPNAFDSDSVAVYVVIAEDVDGNESESTPRAGAYRFTLESGE